MGNAGQNSALTRIQAGVKRFLPPLLLVVVVGLVAWRALARPQREAARARIEAGWEATDATNRERVVDLASRYLVQFPGEDDRRFAAHAFLRARRLEKAVQARWPDVDRPLPAEEVKEFALEALVAFGWDDEARTRPSIQNTQVAVALVEGGDKRTRAWLERGIARGPIEDVYLIMRRSVRLRSALGRDLFARGCRARAQAEARDGVPDSSWLLAAAVMALGPEPYPERDADLMLLLEVLNGPSRVQFHQRWTLACRAIGASEDPRALEALRTQIAKLEGRTDPSDQRDLGTLQLALLAGGDWTHSPRVREYFEANEPAMRTARTYAPEVLLDRWYRGDARALYVLHQLWRREGETDLGLRETIARGLLLGGPLPTADVSVDELLAGLDSPELPSRLRVLALAFRLRRGDPGARDALVRWLAYDPGVSISPQQSPERASMPLVTALQALYLYD